MEVGYHDTRWVLTLDVLEQGENRVSRSCLCSFRKSLFPSFSQRCPSQKGEVPDPQGQVISGPDCGCGLALPAVHSSVGSRKVTEKDNAMLLELKSCSGPHCRVGVDLICSVCPLHVAMHSREAPISPGLKSKWFRLGGAPWVLVVRKEGTGLHLGFGFANWEVLGLLPVGCLFWRKA